MAFHPIAPYVIGMMPLVSALLLNEQFQPALI